MADEPVNLKCGGCGCLGCAGSVFGLIALAFLITHVGQVWGFLDRVIR